LFQRTVRASFSEPLRFRNSPCAACLLAHSRCSREASAARVVVDGLTSSSQSKRWCKQELLIRRSARLSRRRGRPQQVSKVDAILPHGATPPATLCLGGLGHGSRNWRCSPTPCPNWRFFAVPSSSQRVLQLWSNRTWSTWQLFWSRKWPSEASNHRFFPLRGLGEGCALWGARKSSLTWGAARPKRRYFTQK